MGIDNFVLWALVIAAAERALQTLLVECVARGRIASAHDVSDGGLAVALAECGFGENLMFSSEPLRKRGQTRTSVSVPFFLPRGSGTSLDS